MRKELTLVAAMMALAGSACGGVSPMPNAANAVKIRIGPASALSIGGKPTDLTSLSKMIEQDRKLGMENPVMIYADATGQYHRAMEVLDLFRKNRRAKVGLVSAKGVAN